MKNLHELLKNLMKMKNLMSSTEPTVLEFLSQSFKEYTGLDIQDGSFSSRIIFGILVDVMAVILVASWFIPTVRETVVELAEPIIATLKRQGKERIIEKREEVKRKLSEKIHQL